VFVQPLQHEFGWDRSAISITAVLSMLPYGALGPLAGRLADRYRPRWVLVVSVFLAGIGAVASSTMSRLWQFHLYYGLITSMGAGGAAMVTAAAMTSRWFAERRAVIMGLVGAGVSAGQLAFLPLAARIEMVYGWRWSFAGMDHGFPKMAASGAVGLMGAMNVIGTTASGYIADRYGKRIPLAMYYYLRGLSLFFLLGVASTGELNLFAIVFGLNYISTVPPTAMLTADLFGGRSVGTLFGWIFFGHQVGAALASYVGGAVYDLTGAYNWAFISAGSLGILAAGMVLAIREPERPRPVITPIRLAPAAGD
jgi:MFS family permease